MNSSMIILDGGMGRELERIGAPFRQPEWSALALMESPQSVVQAHQNFINAGAQIITTNAYALVPFHIGQDIYDERGAALIKNSALFARQAADAANRRVTVAACIPPVFGSYRPESFDVHAAPDLIRPFLKEQDKYVDLFLAETLSSWQEAQAVIHEFEAFDSKKPLWLSFNLAEEQTTVEPLLRSGELVKDVIQRCLDESPAEALLFNCSAIEDIGPALRAAKEVLTRQSSDVALGAYPNAFSKKLALQDALSISPLRGDISPELFLDYAQQWQKDGATIIGGCCGITPAHIAELMP